jgi:hypothetical protein
VTGADHASLDTVDASDPQLALAPLLDDARSQIVERQSARGAIRLHVSPAIYQALAQLRAFDLARGNPLLLLGAEVVADPHVQSRDFFVDSG